MSEHGLAGGNGRFPDNSGQFYHGTRANLQAGNLLVPGHASNVGGRNATNHIYFTPSLDAARRGAELSVGEGLGRIYRVEPTCPFEDDPNLSEMNFPGNLALSYRTREPIRVLDEVRGWRPPSPEMRIFDNYNSDNPARNNPDPDRDSLRLRSLHQLLWSKKLNSGARFELTASRARRDGYLFTDTSEGRHWYGSDAITASYSKWLRPRSLVDAVGPPGRQEPNTPIILPLPHCGNRAAGDGHDGRTR